MVHPDNETVLRAKENELLGREKAQRNPKHILLSERNPSEKVTYLHGSNDMALWKSWNYRHNEKLVVARG